MNKFSHGLINVDPFGSWQFISFYWGGPGPLGSFFYESDLCKSQKCPFNLGLRKPIMSVHDWQV